MAYWIYEDANTHHEIRSHMSLAFRRLNPRDLPRAGVLDGAAVNTSREDKAAMLILDKTGGYLHINPTTMHEGV